MYTVKQVATLAGVTVRTLHYYDEIGLLPPAEIGENGYRYYNNESLLRLQQILFFREMALSLEEIGVMLDDPDFDLIHALEGHRHTLTQKVERLLTLLDTIDTTINTIKGEIPMTAKGLFDGFTDDEQARMAEQAAQEWDSETVKASQKRWQGYGADKQQAIKAEGNAIYANLAAELTAGTPADAPAVQALIQQWHDHLRYFYEPDTDVLRGLADLYVNDARFAKNIGKLHPGLPAYLKEAINTYCDGLA